MNKKLKKVMKLNETSSNQACRVFVFVSRDCAGHSRPDGVRHLAVRNRRPGGHGGHEVHHLSVRSAADEGQSGSSWRSDVHPRGSVILVCTHTCNGHTVLFL